MTSKNFIHIFLPITALILATLACRAVTSAFSPAPESPQTLPPPPAALEPSLAPINPLATLGPSLAPTDPPASCTNLTDQIIQIANAVTEGSNTADNSSRNNDDGTTLVTYTVSGGKISDPVYEDVPSDLQSVQDDTETQQNIWNYFASLIPADQRQILVEYSVMTDGKDNLLAAVSQTYNDPALWNLEVDIVDANNSYNLTYTLIHEFGHVLTLNPDQVPPSTAIFNNPDDNNIYLQEVSACPDYFPGEGCSEPDSYINAFYNQFWTDIHSEWQSINLEEDDAIYYQRLDDFYIKYQDQFVNGYAATNPEEDIAEAWSFFVLGPKPNGDSITEEKILFFYAYPELIKLRGRILSNLCNSFPQ